MRKLGFSVSALVMVVAITAAAQAPGRQVSIAQGYGLSLATATRAMRYASDVSFEDGRVRARAGVAALGSGGAPPAQTSAADAPLEAGAWYAVNDRRGATYLLHVLTAERGAATVEVAPARAKMQLVSSAGSQRGVPMPTYRGVPMPTYKGVPVPTYRRASVPAAGNRAPKEGKGPAQPAAPAPRDTAPALPPLHGETVDLAVYHMEGEQLTKYYFRKDGSFRREFVGRSALGSVTHEERGDYAIQGGVLTLRLSRTYTAATGGIPNRQYLSGGQSSAASVETHRIRLQGANSAVIDGVRFEHLTW